MCLWQFVTSDFFTSHLKRVVSDDPIRIQDLKAKDHTFFLHALLFFLCQHDSACFMGK